MEQFKYEDLKEMLHNGDIKVTFTKKDGSEREMLCTLRPEIIGETFDKDEDQKEKKEPNTDVIAVWELDKGWRSFRVDSIIKVETV